MDVVITVDDIQNDKVLPFYNSHALTILRILTDSGTEYYGKVEPHDYQLYLTINDIDHTKTWLKSKLTDISSKRGIVISELS